MRNVNGSEGRRDGGFVVIFLNAEFTHGLTHLVEYAFIGGWECVRGCGGWEETAFWLSGGVRVTIKADAEFIIGRWESGFGLKSVLITTERYG